MDGVLQILSIAEQRNIENGRPVGTGRDFIGRGRMRAQPPSIIPDQLLSGQPASPLDKAALNLANINRRIECVPAS